MSVRKRAECNGRCIRYDRVRYIVSVRGYIDATRYRTSGRFNRLNNTVVGSVLRFRRSSSDPGIVVRTSSLKTPVSRKQMLGSRSRPTPPPHSISMALFTADYVPPTTGRSSRVSAGTPSVSSSESPRSRHMCPACTKSERAYFP